MLALHHDFPFGHLPTLRSRELVLVLEIHFWLEHDFQGSVDSNPRETHGNLMRPTHSPKYFFDRLRIQIVCEAVPRPQAEAQELLDTSEYVSASHARTTHKHLHYLIEHVRLKLEAVFTCFYHHSERCLRLVCSRAQLATDTVPLR